MVTTQTLMQLKSEGKKFATLTSYDASFTEIISTHGVEVILVGDSLGNVVQGQTSTLPVTVEDMIYHTKCVVSGNKGGALIMADLPFMSYDTLENTLKNSAALMRAGAHIVKLEGGEWLQPSITQLAERGIPVCVHLGLTPQSVHKFGGYKVQGKDDEGAATILADAVNAEKSGADILLLECVPSALAQSICEKLSIPVIGIGAGPSCDGQVLVLHDLLGISPGKSPKFVKTFLNEQNSNIPAAITAYSNEVKQGLFPTSDHSY